MEVEADYSSRGQSNATSSLTALVHDFVEPVRFRTAYDQSVRDDIVQLSKLVAEKLKSELAKLSGRSDAKFSARVSYDCRNTAEAAVDAIVQKYKDGGWAAAFSEEGSSSFMEFSLDLLQE